MAKQGNMALPWKHNNSSVTDAKEKDVYGVSESEFKIIDKKPIIGKRI